MLKQYSASINTDIYLNAAEELGIEFELLHERTRYYKLSFHGKDLYMRYTGFSFNDSVANQLVKDKNATNDVLKAAGLPVPAQSIFASSDYFKNGSELKQILEYSKALYPIVLKPLNLSLGKGVYTNLSNDSEIEAAFKGLQNMQIKHILAEKFISGSDYRILIFDGEILDVIERIPAYVVGDGTNSIKELIEIKNKLRFKDRTPLINIDDRLEQFIAKSTLSLKSVPEKGTRVRLKGNSNIADGGETKRIDISRVHPDNLKVFIKAAKTCRLRLCGLDFITSDITKSYEKIDSGINELNSMPHPDVHFFADMAMDYSIPKVVLANYFELK